MTPRAVLLPPVVTTGFCGRGCVKDGVAGVDGEADMSGLGPLVCAFVGMLYMLEGRDDASWGDGVGAVGGGGPALFFRTSGLVFVLVCTTGGSEILLSKSRGSGPLSALSSRSGLDVCFD